MCSCRTQNTSIPTATCRSELACLYACSGITAFGAVKKAVGHDAGKPILVIGAGGVGLMGVRFAKSVLGREPIVADIDENKRKLALENGAVAALDPRDKEARKQIMELTGGTGVGAAIDFVGAEASAQFGLRALGRGGRLVIVGLFGGTFSMPMPMFAFTGCQIMGSVTGSPAEMKEMMDLVTVRQGDAGAHHQAQARRGRRHAAGTAQGPDHGARRSGAVTQASRALAYAFETGRSQRSGRSSCAPRSCPFKDIDAEQSFRPEYLRLKRTAWSVAPRIESGAYELGLVLLTKHKEENFANIARGWALLGAGGTLVCAGANDDGAASLEKHVGKAFGLAGSLAKFHCRVFWLTRGERRPPDYWRGLASLQPVGDGSWLSQPGIFSWDRIDDGSALLARHLPDDLSGHVADFGCGWGYLGREVLARSRGVSRIDLIDAEHRALEAARANVADPRASFHWLDLAQRTGARDLRRHRLQSALPCRPRRRAGAWPGRHRAPRHGRSGPAAASTWSPIAACPTSRCSRRASPRSRPWPTTTSSG